MKFDIFNNESRLAAYAVQAFDGGSRRRPEPNHSFRSPFQRDRDRVIHSRAFRRLDGKTQVFLSGVGDHYRTRLTHTIEVAGLARTMARRLMVNEDLTETIALAHDLGHAPFGHMGEKVLDRLLKESCGGFDHNAQSLRIVDELEEKYPHFDGLNLCWETRAGLVKHRSHGLAHLDGVKLPPQPGLEAQIADIADDLAYYGHDVDDGLSAGLLDDHEMLESVELWRNARDMALSSGEIKNRERLRAYTVRCLIDQLAANAIVSSVEAVEIAAPKSLREVKNSESRLISFSEDFSGPAAELRSFLFEKLYQHPDILEINRRMEVIVEDLFHFFRKRPDCLGEGTRQRISSLGKDRSVADYISGMTDSFARRAYKQFCGCKNGK